MLARTDSYRAPNSDPGGRTEDDNSPPVFPTAPPNSKAEQRDPLIVGNS